MAEDRFADLEAALEVLRASPDDPAAWSRFYHAVSPRIRGYLYLLGERNADGVDDLTQEVLLRFLHYAPWRSNWSTIPKAPVVAGYIRQVARTAFFDRFRKRSMELVSGPVLDPDSVGGAPFDDIWTLLDQAWDALEPEDRVLLRLVIEGRKLTEVAEILEISYSAAGTRVHRLRNKMADLLK